MPIYVWIAIIIVSVVIISMGIGTIITIGIITPKRRSLLETSILEEEKFPGIMKFYQEHLTERYHITSRFKYPLAIYYLQHSTPSNKYLVMSHGHTYTHHGCLKYARMMMKYGYNIILYDQRVHGDSGGTFTSLGYYEQYDLYDIVTHIYERFGPNIELGTYGESMGAATVIMEASIDTRIQYVFADCCFSDFNKLLYEIISKNTNKALRFFIPFVRFAFLVMTKVSITRISPIKALAGLRIPVYFAHGLNDGFIGCQHSELLYESYSGKKTLFLADNDAKHAESYWKDQVKYEQIINEFMNKYIQ